MPCLTLTWEQFPTCERPWFVCGRRFESWRPKSAAARIVSTITKRYWVLFARSQICLVFLLLGFIFCVERIKRHGLIALLVEGERGGVTYVCSRPFDTSSKCRLAWVVNDCVRRIYSDAICRLHGRGKKRGAVDSIVEKPSACCFLFGLFLFIVHWPLSCT